MYSYLKDTDECGKTAKGIKKNVIKKDIKHENYKDVLFNNKQVYHNMKTIRSNNHKLGTYEINKISLSCSDDKRYLHSTGIDSYAYGHYKVQLIYILSSTARSSRTRIMLFDDGSECEVSFSDIVRPENLSKGQLVQIQSQVV